MKKFFVFMLTLIVLFSFAVIPSGARPAVYPGAHGDVNVDGNINVSDVSLIMKYIAKWDLGEQTFLEDAADVTHDDIINTSDVTKMLKYLAGWYDFVVN